MLFKYLSVIIHVGTCNRGTSKQDLWEDNCDGNFEWNTLL